MPYMPVRVNDPQINEWLQSKKNKSETTRQALKMLYQKELQDNYDKQEVKPILRLIDA